MIIRILIFFLSVVFFAFLITWMASLDGRIEAQAFGLKFDGGAGIVVGGFVVILGLVALGTSLFKDISAMPEKIRRRDKDARRERGVAALTRGLEAVAVGDAKDAEHHARVARRHLDESALTRLLTAQAAQLSGDHVAANNNFTAMLEAPETEFLGLRGLYVQAIKDGDKRSAQGHAERAFNLRPNARWAFDSVFDLGLERGAWGETRAALARAQKNKVLGTDEARRGEAALMTADAYAADLSGDVELAAKEAAKAAKLAPSLTPAAVLAARLLTVAGKQGKALKILESSFAAAPHPAITTGWRALIAEDPPERRAAKLKQLADKAGDAREAKLLYARAHLLDGANDEAIDLLSPLLTAGPHARELALMAEAVAGAQGDAAAKPWLERAANAPRDPAPGAEGAFHFTREGWARLVREFMAHERLAPPPLEDAPTGLSLEEIKLLAAPPVVETLDLEPEAPGLADAPEDAAPEAIEPEAETSAHGSLAEDKSPDDEEDVVPENDAEGERAMDFARRTP